MPFLLNTPSLETVPASKSSSLQLIYTPIALLTLSACFISGSFTAASLGKYDSDAAALFPEGHHSNSWSYVFAVFSCITMIVTPFLVCINLIRSRRLDIENERNYLPRTLTESTVMTTIESEI